MDNVLTRPFQPADAAAVAELFNAVTVHAGGRANITPDMIAGLVATLVREPAADTRVAWHGDTAVGCGLVRYPPPGGDVCMLHGGVVPGWRGRGLGRELLGWQLARVGEIHLATAPASTWRGRISIMQDDEDAVRLFTRFGLAPARYWFDMVAEVAPPTGSVPAAPEGFRFVSCTAAHEPALHAVHMEVFADHWGFQYRDLDEWAELTVRSPRFAPELSLLALDGEEIAGYVVCHRAGEAGRFDVSNVGVRKAWRRRGLAGAMLTRVLAEAGTAGMRQAMLGVDAASPTGAVGVYERVGFRVEARAVTYDKEFAAASA